MGLSTGTATAWTAGGGGLDTTGADAGAAMVAAGVTFVSTGGGVDFGDSITAGAGTGAGLVFSTG